MPNTPRQLVFLLHGMGEHSKGWSKKGVDYLTKGAKTLKFDYTVGADREVEFIELTYGRFFDDYLKDYENHAEALSKLPVGVINGLPDFSKAIVKAAKTSPNQDNMLVTHWGDVALYALALIGPQIRDWIKLQIEETLLQRGYPEWSVIAHSLGARVIHDTLDEWFTANPNAYMVPGKPNLLLMIGNVIALMSRDRDVMWRDTLVYPHTDMKRGACFKYVNVDHPMDPFTWVRSFDPMPEWGDGAASTGSFFEPVLKSSHLTCWNPHAFGHYCRNPLTQAAFFRHVMGERLFSPIDEEQLPKAMEKYRKATIEGGYLNLKDQFEDLKLGDIRELKKFVETLKAYFEVLESFDEDC
ncbi:hypothetical protein HBA55_32550 [Pseudomaricurvus alkylphenolicus]|uniref:hypothetical protein n=1 Tax=Pseudomaricurvus alkylphenolicus TaxID=1306991 RepID=UPI00141F0998|nr:hypothetical protein [Pseudomaricurvus alkylphenolicus]NIB44370.1 hypothetical protein [Pseudomaricurvus alkylphenolicus]